MGSTAACAIAPSAAPAAEASDAVLLKRFVARRDEEAFAHLVRRHGPLVLGVCRRVLSDGHDAEDAFQATFLVLARRARRIRRRGSLPSWLYRVAYHVALRARASRPRERWAEEVEWEAAVPDVLAQLASRDAVRAIDEEIQRMPADLRLPLVLCCLEGKDRGDAARQLGCSANTVKWRLERGRQQLRVRLARRGLVFTAVLSAAHAVQRQALAGVTSGLVASTASAGLQFAGGTVAPGAISAVVMGLVREGMRAMVVSQVKGFVIALAGVAGLALGIPVLAWAAGHGASGEEPTSTSAAQTVIQADEEPTEAPTEVTVAPAEGADAREVARLADEVKELRAALAAEREAREKAEVARMQAEVARKKAEEVADLERLRALDALAAQKEEAQQRQRAEAALAAALAEREKGVETATREAATLEGREFDLMKQRLLTLRERESVLEASLEAGRATLENRLRAARDTIEAELALMQDRAAEREDLLKAYVGKMHQIEQRYEQLGAEGRAGGERENVLAAQAARLEAELLLLRETASQAEGSDPATGR